MLRLKTVLQYKYTTLLVLLIALLLSVIRINIPNHYIYNKDTANFKGILIQKKVDGDKFSFTIKSKEKIKCTYYIKTEEEKNYLASIPLGTNMVLTGILSEANNNTIPNTFNYKKYLSYNGINYLLTVDSISIQKSELSFIYKIKNALDNYIGRFISKGYLYTFITGNKDNLEEDVFERYQELGVSHIFAISGMHVSILASIIFKLLYKLKENYKYYIIIIFLLIYSSITNYTASILRSISLYICLFLNKRFDFNLETIQIYYIAIAVLLLIQPNLIMNIGFQYSAITSYSLIRYNYLIKGRYVTKCLIISFIAFMFSLPISVCNNYEINILSIINNLIFVPLITFIIYPLSLLCLFLPILDNFYFFIMNYVELLSNKLLVLNIIIPKMNIYSIFIYYVFISLYFYTFESKYLLITIILLTFIKIYPYLDFNSYVYFLDVNQGDAIVIKKQDKAILIDTGGIMSYKKEKWQERESYHISTNIITFIKSKGIDNLDYLILSHGDFDHMGESITIVNNFKVDKVIFNCGEFNDLENELINVLDKKKISYYSCIKELNIDDNKLHFLNNKIYDNENDNSSVIYTELNNHKFLFMGDAGVEVEKDLIKKYNLQDIDVLKVGHHGSMTSSGKEFINEIKHKYSIISVGKNNRYGHPNTNVLDNLEKSKIYRTDRDGSIMFKVKNNKLEIKTCVP